MAPALTIQLVVSQHHWEPYEVTEYPGLQMLAGEPMSSLGVKPRSHTCQAEAQTRESNPTPFPQAKLSLVHKTHMTKHHT